MSRKNNEMEKEKKKRDWELQSFLQYTQKLLTFRYLVNKLWASRLKTIEALLFCLLAFPNLAIDHKKSKVNLTFTLRLVTPEKKQMFILLLTEFQIN